MQKIAVVFCVVAIGVVMGYPFKKVYKHPVPKRAVMFGGYYSNPMFGKSYDYTPQGAMTAFVSGDTVATNSYSGGRKWAAPQAEETQDQWSPPVSYLPPKTQTEKEEEEEEKAVVIEADVKDTTEQEEIIVEPTVAATVEPEVVIVDKPDEEGQKEEELIVPVEEITEVPVAVTKAPTKAAKRIAKKKVQKPVKEEKEEETSDDEEEDDVSAGWPFAAGRGGRVPNYNAFFPIFFGGSPSARARSDDDFYPGAATAIANSFSTGKGGVASSHATAFGDPGMAAFFKRNGGSFKSGTAKKSKVVPELEEE